MLLLLLSTVARSAEWPTHEDDPAPWSATPTGIQVQDRIVGTGAEVVPGAVAIVTYTGMLVDGTVFDSSADRGNQTLSFRVGAQEVIRGWEDGVVGMRVGGTRRLVIPPDQGYGARDVGPIPSNSVLYFEIQLADVVPPRAVPSPSVVVDDSAWVDLGDGVRIADLTVGTGHRLKPAGRVCIDYVSWRGTEVVEETYTRDRCTWIRLDDDNLPEAVEIGLAKMREGGVRRIVVAPDLIWQVQLTTTAK